MTQGKDPTGARKGNNSSNGIGDLLRHPLLLVIIAGVFTLLGAILTARLSPEPKVLTTDSRTQNAGVVMIQNSTTNSGSCARQLSQPSLTSRRAVFCQGRVSSRTWFRTVGRVDIDGLASFWKEPAVLSLSLLTPTMVSRFRQSR